MDILQTKNLQFAGIIDYPDLSISEFDTTFIIGESGCGKSSLLKLFNLTVSPSKGQIFYKGNSLDSYDTILLRREILLASQSVFLFDDTILQNFKEYYCFRECELIDTENMKYFLHLCSADFSLSTQCHTLSGGERQRVFMAICLSFLPKVIMLDEPTSALDEKTANAFLSNIKEFCIQNKISLIIVSHDKKLTEKYGDKVIFLEKGGIQ